MVFICSQPFNENEKYNNYFQYFDGFNLSEFQKWAIKAVVEGDHILITAHTGSGKTLPAEFMIQYFANKPDNCKKRKIIYASQSKHCPIKNYKTCAANFRTSHLDF